jgi:hypothetical protein
LEKGSVGIQVREVRKVDKGRRKISALLSFVSFSKLVILVYTGQPVENNTAYARYRCWKVEEGRPSLANIEALTLMSHK